MSNEQKVAMAEARAAEATVVLIELDEAQVAAMAELGLTDDRDNIAAAAFNSALKGKVAGVRDRAIKAKYIAESKGKPALSAECEKEIQAAIRLYKMLG